MPTVTSGGPSNAWEEQQQEEPPVFEEKAAEEEAPVAPEEEVVELPRAEADTPKVAEVRSWAIGNGISISSRGAVPAAVMQAYLEAHRDEAG